MEELYNEADTRAKLIDPALHQRGWSEDKIKREETPGAVDVVDGKPRKRAHGRIDYTLRARVNSDTQPVALALIEAKSEQFSPAHGLQQGKEYADATKRLNVQFVFSTNGHRVVEYDCITGETTDPYPISEFPTPDDLRQRYENAQGFSLNDLDDFRTCWIHPQDRRTFMARLPDQGRSAQVVRSLDNMTDYDLYDILAELGYGLAPKTRIHRADAFFYKHDQWLNTLPAPTADTLKALTMQFARTGTDGLENPRVFTTPEVTQAGGINALAQIGQPADLLVKIKERIFAL